MVLVGLLFGYVNRVIVMLIIIIIINRIIYMIGCGVFGFVLGGLSFGSFIGMIVFLY